MPSNVQTFFHRSTIDALRNSRDFHHELAQTGLFNGKTLPSAEALTPDKLSYLSHRRNDAIAHRTELQRKLAKVEKLIEKSGSADTTALHIDKTKLQKEIARYDAHPLSKFDPAFLSGKVTGYSSNRKMMDQFSAKKAAAKLFLRENRILAIPLVGLVFLVKMTLGLWLLHKFDTLFGTQTVKGKPLSSENQTEGPGHKRNAAYAPAPGYAPAATAMPYPTMQTSSPAFAAPYGLYGSQYN